MVNDVCSRTFYSLTLIQALVRQGHFFVSNQRAVNKLEDLGWDSQMLKSFIFALNDSHFVRKYPLCDAGNNNIDCDGYKMFFDEDNRIENNDDGLVFFIKLAISNRSKTFIVSFHLNDSPG